MAEGAYLSKNYGEPTPISAVRVVNVGGPCQEAGLRPGDLISSALPCGIPLPMVCMGGGRCLVGCFGSSRVFFCELNSTGLLIVFFCFLRNAKLIRFDFLFVPSYKVLNSRAFLPDQWGEGVGRWQEEGWDEVPFSPPLSGISFRHPPLSSPIQGRQVGSLDDFNSVVSGIAPHTDVKIIFERDGVLLGTGQSLARPPRR